MSKSTRLVRSLIVVFAAAAIPAHALQRVFVASTGSDASSCIPTSPCRSFAHAITVVDPGGEIVALDAAGYGAVTIDRSVTITANPGFYAGIAAGSGNAVTIATSGVNVVLRGLNINGIGAINGVEMTNGSLLSIENCVISNFSNAGVTVHDTSAAVKVADSLVRGNGAWGVLVESGPTAYISNSTFLANGNVGAFARGATTSTLTVLVVSDSRISGGQIGFGAYAPAAGATARATAIRTSVSNASSYGVLSSNGSGTQLVAISYSQVTENAIGLENIGGTLQSMGNNQVINNGTNVAGTITSASGI